MKKAFALFAASLFALSVTSPTGVVAKEEEQRAFEFHVGDAFTQGFGFDASDEATATMGTSRGDTIQVIATGELRTNGRKASGTGSFNHKSKPDAQGHRQTLAVGSFRAVRLMSPFTDLGPGPETPAALHSGTAVILLRVVAHPTSNLSATATFDAVLTIDCDLGNAHQVTEGITFRILNGPARGLFFDHKDRGVTVFVTKPEEEQED